MVDRQPVKSSNVRSVGYDKETSTLAVEFNGGSVYHYHDVPKEVHENLIASRSVGGFLSSNIRGKFKHSKQ
jgi:hypothetical protein